MKKRRYWLVMAALLILGGLLWLLWTPNPVERFLTLAPVTAGSAEPSDEMTFRLANSGPRFVMPEEMAIEVQTPSGWRVANRGSLQRIGRLRAGASSLVVVKVPDGGRLWRMRVEYRYELRGFALWTAQVGIAFRSRKHGQVLAPGIIGVEPIISERAYSLASGIIHL